MRKYITNFLNNIATSQFMLDRNAPNFTFMNIKMYLYIGPILVLSTDKEMDNYYDMFYFNLKYISVTLHKKNAFYYIIVCKCTT